MQHRSGNDLPQAEQFYFATTKIGIGRVIVAATIFRRRAVLLCDDENWNRTRHRSGNDLLQAELFYFAAKKIRIGRSNVAATTLRRRNCSTLRRRKLESDATSWRQRPSAGGPFYSPARWRCSDSRFQAQNCESMQPKGQIWGNPCIDS